VGDVRGLVAILAGGAGERLERRKPLASLGGRPLIQHALAAARASGLGVVVVSKPGVALGELDCELVYEPERPRHPLCGLLAALAQAEGRDRELPVVAIACDMPFLTGPLLAWLAARRPASRAALARVSGRLEPLLGRYLPAQRPTLARALCDACSMRDAAMRLQPLIVEEHELARFGDPRRLCFNVNTAADLRVAEAWLGGLSGGRGDLRGAGEQLSQRPR
jgi:molybdenum cofactor guanylyltransferase